MPRLVVRGPRSKRSRVVEGGDHLILDVGGIGAVVAPQLPGGQEVAAPLHVLGQAGRPPPGDDAAPTGWIGAARQDDHPVADRPDGALQGPEGGDLRLQLRVVEVLAHSRRVAAGQEQAVEIGRLDLPPRERVAKCRVLGQLLIEEDRLRLGAELAEEDAVEQLRVALRSTPTALGREDDLVAAVGEQPPGHRDLGRVEIAIGQGDEDAHGRGRRLAPPRTRVKSSGLG